MFGLFGILPAAVGILEFRVPSKALFGMPRLMI